MSVITNKSSSCKVQRLFRSLTWMTHPITIFVSLQVVWLAITLIWVIWFVGEQAEIAQMAQRFGREYFDSTTVLAILVVGCVLLGVLLFGTIALFVFGQRQSSLARQQRSFVSSVTHELKSPLASLQLAVETAIERKLDETTTSRMNEIILADIERLRRLVDQILVAGRLDKGMMFDEAKQHVSLRKLIDNIVKTATYLDPKITDRFHLDCPSDMNVKLSEGALRLVFSNLIENAIKYSPKGAPIVAEVRQDGDAVLFVIKDQGFGLEKKDRRRIFRMFHRSESAIHRAVPGTGLGLYIVKSVVKALGGKVWAESPGRDQGTAFYVSLPAAAL